MQDTIVFASQNKHKIQEVRDILKDYNVISLADIDFNQDIEENGKTFEENAIIKSRAIIDYLKEKGLNYKVLSDDTGLCVDALNGRPGIYSARYVMDHNDKKNREKILEELKNSENRNANFTCVVCLMDSDYNYKIGVGKTYGYILTKEYGDTSFGYDCIFYSNDLNKSFGEATSQEKNSVSHRARAIKNLFNIVY